jgi:hypothetical protein
MTGGQIFRAAAVGALLMLIPFASASGGLAHAQPPATPGSFADWLRLNGVAAALIAGAVALFGHLAAVWANLIARTYSAKIETAIECRFFAPQSQGLPIELRFLIENKGGRRIRLSQLSFWIRGIEAGVPLVRRKDQKLSFPKQYVKGEFVVPADEWLFVDSGTTQAFTFPAMIPAGLSLILVRMRISPKRGYRYTEERVFQASAFRGA